MIKLELTSFEALILESLLERAVNKSSKVEKILKSEGFEPRKNIVLEKQIMLLSFLQEQTKDL